MSWGLLFRPHSLWIGTHWSSKNKRICTNFVPFFTLWITFEGGETPRQGNDIYRSDR